MQPFIKQHFNESIKTDWIKLKAPSAGLIIHHNTSQITKTSDCELRLIETTE